MTSGSARLAARVVVVTLPEYHGSTVLPPEGFQDTLMARWVTLREVEGPLVNGAIALTWEDDPTPDGDLVAHSASIINDLLELPASTAPDYSEPDGVCEWYALCFNQAVGVVSHPILGPVPCCQRCADKHGMTFDPN